jgi:DNA polymerase-3 subunit epsilon
LNAELARAAKPKLNPDRAIDTMLMARRKFPGSPASLDALCKRFDISLDERRAKGHGALLDVELLAQVYLELLGGRQPGLELIASDAVQANGSKVAHVPIPPRPKTLPSRLTAEELARHEAAVASLGAGAIWRN